MDGKEKRLYQEFLQRHLKSTGKSKEEFYKTRAEIQRPVKILDTVFEGLSAHIDLRVDLKFSKNKIMQELGRSVQKWKTMFEEDFAEFIHDNEGPYEDSDSIGQMIEQYRESRLDEHYKKRLRDPSLKSYEQALQVWDLRKNGKSWPLIVEELSFVETTDMARNLYKIAERCIGDGPPWGPPFT